jgi:uncharacterized membrane protein YdbT with pleckstrin-like domain
MPLSKITDLSMRRTIVGRLLGYGGLRIETAGQKRSLDHLDFLSSTICRAVLRATQRRENWPPGGGR